MLGFSIYTCYDLEVYFFKLSIYTDSQEYLELDQKKKIRIDREILDIGTSLSVLRRFTVVPKREKAIVATNMDGDGRVFRFSSIAVAKRVLEVSGSNIQRCCIGERKHSGGYRFKYEEDYIEVVKKQPKWYDHNFE
jgi:hypothetical protein